MQKITNWKSLIFPAVLLLSSQFGLAQQHAKLKANADRMIKITGTCFNKKHIPLPSAVIKLITSKDTTYIKQDDKGHFSISIAATPGNYQLIISDTCCQTLHLPIVINAASDNIDLGTIVLPDKIRQLREIEINQKDPVIKREIDRIVIKTDQLATAGNTFLDILKASPGIVIDAQNNIKINGKSGVRIMLNGRSIQMSGAQAKTFMETLPADQVSSIEIITNPPARYDAEGTAAIINIVMKRKEKGAAGGRMSTTYSQGEYASFSEGVGVFYNKGKLSTSASVDLQQQHIFSYSTELRRYHENGNDIYFDQYHSTLKDRKNARYNASAEFNFNKKHHAGIDFNAYNGNDQTPYIAETNAYTRYGKTDSSFNNENYKSYRYNTIGTNLYYDFHPDSSKQLLSVNLGFTAFDDRQSVNNNTHFFDQSHHTSRAPDRNDVNNPTRINIYTIGIDYTKPLKASNTIDAGAKLSFISTDNSITRYNQVKDTFIIDDKNSDKFRYRETVAAAYINWKKEWEKWTLQLGNRTEWTAVRSRSYTLGSAFNRDYYRFFPSAFIQYTANEDNIFGISYSRRIGRPTYQSLNPFKFYYDPYQYYEGNPYLQPEYTNSFEANYLFKDKYSLTAGYSVTTDVMEDEYSRQIDSTREFSYSIINIGKQYNYSIAIAAPFKVTKWWDIQCNASWFYNRYTGTARQQLSAKGNLELYVSSVFKLPHKFSLQLSGDYSSSSVDAQTIYKANGNLNAVLRKKILKDKGTIRIALLDIFKTNFSKGIKDFENQYVLSNNASDSRRCLVAFQYSFSKKNAGAKSAKEAVNKEEVNRIKGMNQ
ncbi:TonB-dependent receptor domain-containing protein [Chitinophaga sp. 22321]|uniref:TonB-dependent receptor n=1 Tax=Chitinophaga hostae TaxID=2831022 RepID=A0ABS5JA72_9BACT|nr:TonB-dependent receptor [Chitinophaga hostae]MBS0032099.1 TonB-dependent receptor [Chitinophaga hostae]